MCQYSSYLMTNVMTFLFVALKIMFQATYGACPVTLSLLTMRKTKSFVFQELISLLVWESAKP